MKTQIKNARVLVLVPHDEHRDHLLSLLKELDNEILCDPEDCGPVDLVIKDAHMLLLLEDIEFNAPLMVISDPDDHFSITETKAERFLFRPFSKAELEHSIKCCLNEEKEVENELVQDSTAKDLVRIHVSELTDGKSLVTDAYIKTDEGSFVRFPRKCLFDQKEVKTFLDQGINSLYVLKSDYRTYLGLDEFYLFIPDPDLKQRKQNFFVILSKILKSETVFIEANPYAFQKAKIGLEAAISLLVDNKEIFEILEVMIYKYPEALKKNLWVALCSVLTAQNMATSNTRANFILTCSGLFHDLSFIKKSPGLLTHMKALPPEVFDLINDKLHPFQDVLELAKTMESVLSRLDKEIELWMLHMRAMTTEFSKKMDPLVLEALLRYFQEDELKASSYS